MKNYMMDMNNAVLEAAPAEPTTPAPARMNIANELETLKKVYDNSESSIETQIQNGTYTAATVTAHVETIKDIAEELNLIYDLDAETQEQLDNIVGNALLTQNKLEESILKLKEVAARLENSIDELTEVNVAVTETNTVVNSIPVPQRFLTSLKYMGLGMLIIMLVMCILIAGTALLNKATNAIAEAKRKRENAENENKEV